MKKIVTLIVSIFSVLYLKCGCCDDDSPGIIAKYFVENPVNDSLLGFWKAYKTAHNHKSKYLLNTKDGMRYNSYDQPDELYSIGTWDSKNGHNYSVHTRKSVGDLGCPYLVRELISYYKMIGTDTLWLREKPFTEGFRYIDKYVRIADSLAITIEL